VQFQQYDDACAQQRHFEHEHQGKRVEVEFPQKKETDEKLWKDTPPLNQNEKYEQEKKIEYGPFEQKIYKWTTVQNGAS